MREHDNWPERVTHTKCAIVDSLPMPYDIQKQKKRKSVLFIYNQHLYTTSIYKQLAICKQPAIYKQAAICKQPAIYKQAAIYIQSAIINNQLYLIDLLKKGEIRLYPCRPQPVRITECLCNYTKENPNNPAQYIDVYDFKW